MTSVSEVEHDGRIVSENHDTPDPRSVYIPPGSPERETYRLSTFKDFPQTVRINSCKFAACGFYYTGIGDRVKCFSCCQAVESWLVGDDVTQPRWHKPDCPYLEGNDTRNIPISSVTTNFWRKIVSQNQGQTYANGTRDSGFQSSSTLNYSSAHYSPTVVTPPFSVISASRAAENYSSGSSLFQNERNPEELEERKRRLFLLFPCNNPVNPHMKRVDARLQTFLDNPGTWPAHRIRASHQEIADAGMYYLGERDRVKCWYCNGGLQNWEQDDNPWEEHAKWFPMCEYVLQRKGPEFVHEIVSNHPNLRRPELYNPATAPQAGRLRQVLNENTSSSSRSRSGGQRPEIIDPQDEIKRRNEKIDEIMATSEVIGDARMMGFTNAHIREAFKRKYESCSCGFPTLRELVDYLLDIESKETAAEEEDTQPKAAVHQVPDDQVAATSQIGEMQRLENSRQCKVCRNEVSCVVFLPCGHLTCCINCSEKVQKCPVCDETIRERIRTFVS